MGYILTALDVFVWVLLTAGTILVPVVVLTICCVRKHYKDERRLTRLYLTSSQDHLSRGEKPPLNRPAFNQTQFNPGNMIVNSVLADAGVNANKGGPGGLETPNTLEKNKVRFKDEPGEQNGERKTNQYNKNIITPQVDNFDADNNNNNNAAGGANLRGLKDAVNLFVPRPTKPAPKNTIISNQLPILPNLNSMIQSSQLPTLQFNQYTNDSDITDQNASNLSGSYNLPPSIANKNNSLRTQQNPNEPVYSISNSYRMPQMNNQMINPNNQIPPQQRISSSIENIYSKVLTMPKNNQDRILRQPDNDNDEQPLYMNTPYTPENSKDGYDYSTVNIQNQNQQVSGRLINPPIYGSWNDSSV